MRVEPEQPGEKNQNSLWLDEEEDGERDPDDHNKSKSDAERVLSRPEKEEPRVREVPCLPTSNLEINRDGTEPQGR